MFVIDHDPLNRVFFTEDDAVEPAGRLSEIVRAEVEVLRLNEFGPNEHGFVFVIEPRADGTEATWCGDASDHGREWWR